LEDFYKDMHKWGFPMQIYLLNKRFKQQQQIVWQGHGGIQDRTIYEDSVFARMLRDSGHLESRDFDTYMELFQNMANFMKKPNLIVHLDLTAEESYRRIKMRSRDCESAIPLEYLTALHAAYEVFISDIARVIPVIKVDYSQFRTAEEMAKVVKAEYAKIANVRHVNFGAETDSAVPASIPQQMTTYAQQVVSKPQVVVAKASVGRSWSVLISVLKLIAVIQGLRVFGSVLRRGGSRRGL